MYGQGISKEGSVIDTAVDLGIVKKAGSWFTYGEDRLGQGRENAKKQLITHPELREEIEHKVRVAVGLELGDERVGDPVDLEETDVDIDLAVEDEFDLSEDE